MSSIQPGQEVLIYYQQSEIHSHDAAGNCVTDVTSFKRDVQILNDPDRYTVYFSNCFCHSIPALALGQTVFADDPAYCFHPHPVYSHLALCSFPKNPESLTALQRLASKLSLRVQQNVEIKVTVPAPRLEVVHNQVRAVNDQVNLTFPAANHVLFLTAPGGHNENRARHLFQNLSEWAPGVVAGEEEKQP